MIELYCLVLNCSHFHSPRYILIKNYRLGLYFLMEKRNKVQLPAGGLFLPAKRNKTLEKKTLGASGNHYASNSSIGLLHLLIGKVKRIILILKNLHY